MKNLLLAFLLLMNVVLWLPSPVLSGICGGWFGWTFTKWLHKWFDKRWPEHAR